MIRQKNQKSKIALANDVNIVEVGQKFVKLVKTGQIVAYVIYGRYLGAARAPSDEVVVHVVHG